MGVVINWSSSYPATKDTILTNFPTVTNGTHTVVATHVNSLASAVVEIQGVLGGLRSAPIADPLSLSDGDTLIWDSGGGEFVAGSVVTTDELVKVSANDTTAGFLNGKLVAGTGISLTENNNGSNETLTIASAASGKQTASIIVGNSGSGDTLADCDYLDTGNGVQLAAAIAAASPGSDVYVRPGTYDLGAGAVSTPISVPANVQVRGAGPLLTTVVTKASGNMGAFVVADFSSIRDMGLTVPLPTGAGSGATSIININGAQAFLYNLLFLWTPGFTGTEAGYLALRACIGATADLSGASHIERVSVASQPSLRALSVSSDLCGFKSEANLVNDPGRHRIVNCLFSGGDIGVWAQSLATISSTWVYNAYTAHIRVSNSLNRGSTLSDNHTIHGSTVPTSGHVLVEDANETKVVGHTGENTVGTAATGVSLLGADNCVVSSNTWRSLTTAISLDASSDNNIVMMNNCPSCTTAVSDAGTDNETSHNI